MSRSAKYNKVEVQRGPIMPNTPPTMNMQTPREQVEEDYRHSSLRRDGQTCQLMTPKQ